MGGINKDRAISSEVAKRIAMQTFVSTIASVGMTALTLWLAIGTDFRGTLSVGHFWAVALGICTVAPVLICPLIAIPAARLMQQLQDTQEDLANAALTDHLTGLLNRRGFDQAAEAALAASRRKGAPIAAMMCDIDRFKTINDKFGHEFGDIALAKIADIISASVGRREALLSRQGGEEFAILLPDADSEEAFAIAERAREACESAAFDWEGFAVRVTISIGLAADISENIELRPLLNRADAALYQAKRDGRNRVVAAPAPRRLSLVA